MAKNINKSQTLKQKIQLIYEIEGNIFKDVRIDLGTKGSLFVRNFNHLSRVTFTVC